jgi:predicted  nucleic acid-binding Zn-ribbon protein
MAHPALAPLLILQDRDSKRIGLETQLKSIPREVAALEQRIAVEKTAIEAARTEVKELESKKKLLETEIGSTETKLGQYRTQQLSIRKNDEYQAMGQQIAATQVQISELEGKELEIMYAIDEAKKRFAVIEGELKANVAVHESRIRTLRERESNIAAELKEAQAQTAEAQPAGE